jgi:hypothetical protein
MGDVGPLGLALLLARSFNVILVGPRPWVAECDRVDVERNP